MKNNEGMAQLIEEKKQEIDEKQSEELRKKKEKEEEEKAKGDAFKRIDFLLQQKIISYFDISLLRLMPQVNPYFNKMMKSINPYTGDFFRFNRSIVPANFMPHLFTNALLLTLGRYIAKRERRYSIRNIFYKEKGHLDRVSSLQNDIKMIIGGNYWWSRYHNKEISPLFGYVPYSPKFDKKLSKFLFIAKTPFMSLDNWKFLRNHWWNAERIFENGFNLGFPITHAELRNAIGLNSDLLKICLLVRFGFELNYASLTERRHYGAVIIELIRLTFSKMSKNEIINFLAYCNEVIRVANHIMILNAASPEWNQYIETILYIEGNKRYRGNTAPENLAKLNDKCEYLVSPFDQSIIGAKAIHGHFFSTTHHYFYPKREEQGRFLKLTSIFMQLQSLALEIHPNVTLHDCQRVGSPVIIQPKFDPHKTTIDLLESVAHQQMLTNTHDAHSSYPEFKADRVVERKEEKTAQPLILQDSKYIQIEQNQAVIEWQYSICLKYGSGREIDYYASNGFSYEEKDSLNRTSIHHVTRRGDLLMFHHLAHTYNIDTSLPDADRQTILHHAAQSHNPYMIDLCARYVGDFQAQNRSNQTVLQHAKATNNDFFVVKRIEAHILYKEIHQMDTQRTKFPKSYAKIWATKGIAGLFRDYAEVTDKNKKTMIRLHRNRHQRFLACEIVHHAELVKNDKKEVLNHLLAQRDKIIWSNLLGKNGSFAVRTNFAVQRLKAEIQAESGEQKADNVRQVELATLRS